MSKAYKRKTRNFFIKKDLQGKLLYQNFLLTFAGVIIFALIFSFLASDKLTISYENQHLEIGRTPFVLLKEMLRAHWFFLVTAGLFATLVNLVTTHRIAGPVYRFEKTFEGMARKNLDQHIHLRSKDAIKDLASQINSFNATLSDDLLEMGRLCDAIEDCLEEAGTEETTNGEQTGRLLNEARSHSSRIKELLAEYKLKPGGKC